MSLTDTPTLTLAPWTDPLLERHGWHACSEEVETYWLPVLGPTSVLLVRLAGRQAPCTFTVEELAGRLGVGHRGGRNSPLARTIGRLIQFGVAREGAPGELQVRTHLAPLPMAKASRLPAGLARQYHDQMSAGVA